jgi:CRISPR-associated protein Cmr2
MDREPNDLMWKAKLAAWIHDPAEKALVLLRDPAGHEGGTVRQLREMLFGSEVPSEIVAIVQEADRWAAAADRPQIPRDVSIYFDKRPVLIHPLDGSQYDLQSLDVPVAQIRAVSFDHFQQLCSSESAVRDWKRLFLTLWRRGPEIPARDLGALWEVLPADTRIPAYSIWQHLDLTSALAGAMARDPQRKPALLKFTIGPVQSFIEQARSSSDLWAGSHLLSRMMWEGLKVICDELGPDAVIFPHLRGVPLVDAWLKEREVLSDDASAFSGSTDENPLLIAAVVNVAVALVPQSEAEELARNVSDAMRRWTTEKARAATEKLCQTAQIVLSDTMRKQIDDQTDGFPEVYWSVVPWLGKLEDAGELERLINQFYDEHAWHFFRSPAWTVLQKGIQGFYHPNPGVLYPAVYDLADRALAAAKAARTFKQRAQQGYRCTLCGEREWLATDRSDLEKPAGQRRDTLWHRVARKRPGWVRSDSRGNPREYLCALCTLKRLWPSLFLDEIEQSGEQVQRYVISTHTMALAPTLGAIAKRCAQEDDGREKAREIILTRLQQKGLDRVALPARLYREVRQDPECLKLVGGIPALLDQLAEEADSGSGIEQERQKIEDAIRQLSGDRSIERYYALLLLDGDRMGAWVSGKEDAFVLAFEQLWHPDVRDRAELRGAELEQYRKAGAVSPARHIFLSRALNNFAVRLVPLIVERLHLGKLLYAGGDDVLAMTSVSDVLSTLAWLRCAYAGLAPSDHFAPSGTTDIRLGGSHALLVQNQQKQLLALMGERATVSAGIVIAHYAAPLQAVLRELRRAEARAKSVPAKNSFSLTLMKRSGGTTILTAPWGNRDAPVRTLEVLERLKNLLASKLTRQAAYAALDWIERLEGTGSGNHQKEMLEAILCREFFRHRKEPEQESGAGSPLQQELRAVVKELVDLTFATGQRAPSPDASPVRFLQGALQTAEFLAREGRAS